MISNMHIFTDIELRQVTETHVPCVGKVAHNLSFGNFEPQIRSLPQYEAECRRSGLLLRLC